MGSPVAGSYQAGSPVAAPHAVAVVVGRVVSVLPNVAAPSGTRPRHHA